MRAIELFAGIGGFRIGLERAGHEVVYANEWDKYAADTYDYNFRDSIDRRSIVDVPASDIPAHDLITGGFPCQAFSIAGKRKGFEETRGTLFFDIMRIAQHHRTPYLFLENVKGLLNHDGGRTFEVILETLDESGYDCQWQVLNSKNFGVPQNRERIIIVGHLRGQPRPQVFPLGNSDSEIDEVNGIHSEHFLTGTLNTKNNSPQLSFDKGTTLIQQLNQPKHSNDRVYGDAGISPTLNTMQGGNRQPKILSHNMSGEAFINDHASTLRAGASKSHQFVVDEPVSIDYKNPNSTTRRGRVKEGYTGTLETTPLIGIESMGRIRRLTPMECERLQGFPDNHTKYGLREGVEYEMSDTQRYKQCGNAVTTNVIEAVARRL